MALDLQKFILRFIEEAREHLGRLGEGLAQLDAGHSDREGVNALFRSAHTIKGSSRMLRLASITAVAHQVEEVLGSLREGSQTYTPALGQLLYRAVDHLAALVDALAQSGNAASLPPADEALCQALAQAGQPATGPQEEVGQVAAPPVPAAPLQAAPVAIPAPAPAPAPLVGPGAAPAVAPANAPPQLQAAQTVRVRLDKLDGLVKLMGEVVASHARLRQRLADIQALLRELGEAPPPALLVFERQLKDDVQVQEGLMHELHDKTLVMRMLALAIVFEPAARLVRELARSVGKEVECQVSGSEIELDRQLIDQLADPIIHLIRNAVDHGIEPPDVRRAAGKPAQGHVQLSARQDGGWVVIELSDDGAGIALQAVRDKAVKKGLLSADKAAALSDQEAIDLIFLPGFSTSSMITDLSGRGVGMDVVKQTVLDELQGSVSVHTRSGMGTTFSLRLPLSLAMLRVLLVQVQGQAFGFTAQHVAELVRLPRSALLPMAEREAVIVRNEFVPVVALEPKTHADVQRVLGKVALVLGVPPARAQQVWQDIDRAMDESARSLPAAARGLRVYFEVSPGPYGAGASSFIGETLARLGARNIIPAELGPFPKLNPEFIVRANPDAILVGARSSGELASRPGWDALPAVRAQRLCVFSPSESDTLVRPGPRMQEGARLMAQCLRKVAAP